MTEHDVCPICGSKLIEKVIDYIDYTDWSNDQLLVIRSVPVRECQEQGHRFFSASVARRLEALFDSEPNPWLANFGRFKDDPTFDDLLNEISTYRHTLESAENAE